MKKQKLNVRLLRKIQKHITEEPRRFFMAWYKYEKQPQYWEKGAWNDLSDKPPPCGTAACIAGWANGLTGACKYDWDNVNRAADKLGLPLGNVSNYGYLFYWPGWPEPYRSRYHRAKTPKQRAKIACQRIDHLIEHGK